MPSTDDELHLWGWDISTENLRKLFGYPADGPNLVLNMLGRWVAMELGMIDRHWAGRARQRKVRVGKARKVRVGFCE